MPLAFDPAELLLIGALAVEALEIAIERAVTPRA